MNASAPFPELSEARRRVRAIQDRLRQRTKGQRPFDDLYNLVYDDSVLTWSWHNVQGKKGARIAGIDKNTVNRVRREVGTDAFLAELRSDLWSKEYAPMPLRRLTGSDRTFHVRTLRDRVVEEALSIILQPILQPTFHPHSFSYQPGVAQPAAAAMLQRKGKTFDCYVRTDIKSCFETIPHQLVLRRLRAKARDRRVVNLVRRLLEAGQTRPGRGVAQGTMLASFLAEVALSDIDGHFSKGIGPLQEPDTKAGDYSAVLLDSVRPPASKSSGRLTAPALLYLRWVDDIVVLVQGGRVQAERIRRFLSDELAKHKLELNVTKTTVGTLTGGFDFLGVNFRRLSGSRQFRVVVSEKNISKWAEDLERLGHEVGPSELESLAVDYLQRRFDHFDQMGADWHDAIERLFRRLFPNDEPENV